MSTKYLSPRSFSVHTFVPQSNSRSAKSCLVCCWMCSHYAHWSPNLTNCCSHPATKAINRTVAVWNVFNFAEETLRQLMVPRHRRSTFGHQTFSVAGPMEWNSLRDSAQSTDGFKSALKTRPFVAQRDD